MERFTRASKLCVDVVRMSYPSTTDPTFLGTLKSWLRGQREILVLIRYSHHAGSKDFEFFTSFVTLSERIRKLPTLACITAFRRPQLPLRGIVDDHFVASCACSIPDGSEFLLLEAARREYCGMSWFHHSTGESHAELREELEEARGVPVAGGLYLSWLVDTDDVVSAVVPDACGGTSGGVY